MKKFIYNIAVITLAVFTFTSCAVDDDEPIVVIPKTSIEASFAVQGDIISIDDNASSYDLVVNFSAPLPDYGSIEYTVDGVAGSVSGNTGDTSVTIPLDFGLGINFHDVTLVGFYVVNADANNFLPSLEGTTANRVIKQGYFTATMNWADAVFDLDLGLQPMTPTWGDTFAWIDVSVGVTNSEFVQGEMMADGNYALFIQHFTPAADVNFSFSIESAGGNFMFDLFTEGDGNHLWFTKSTNGDGVVSYNFFTEDPA